LELRVAHGAAGKGTLAGRAALADDDLLFRTGSFFWDL